MFSRILMMGFLCASSQQLLPCNTLTGLQPQDPRFPETCQTKLILTGVVLACSPFLLWLHFAQWLHPVNIPLQILVLEVPNPLQLFRQKME